jgi:F0F1-type ATP synthase assembly protein I
MRDIFFGREDIAKATNSLFKIGFYLLNIGFALYILRIYNALTGMQDTIEVLSSKVGGFSIYLGVMLFFNLYLFFRGKRVAKQRHSTANSSAQITPQS